MLVTRLLQRNIQDEFGVVDSLVVLKNQISSRMSQLQTLIAAEQAKQQRKTANSVGRPKALATPASNGKDLLLKQTSGSSSPGPVLPTLENASLQLFNSSLAEIETSLLKNLNIKMSDVPNNTRSYKVPMINKPQINQIEHSLQLLNFKGSDDLKLRNEYLTKLNMFYYSEMLAQQEVIKDVVSVVKDLESGMENNPRWTKVNQINDESVLAMVGEFQQRISNLEREKLHMENEIVKLKERWNNLVEGARRRKEQEKELYVSRTDTSPVNMDHNYSDKPSYQECSLVTWLAS